MPITIDSNIFQPIHIRTVPVFEEEYLGDSLGKINYNFFILDTALANLSAIFFYQQPGNWRTILDDLRYYLPALSSFGDYIYTKENYIRFNTMYNTVKALSAYWGRMEVHILYPLDVTQNISVFDYTKIIETEGAEIVSLAQQYVNLTFNPNNYLPGSKVRVGFLIYNKKPELTTNLIATFSTSPSGAPASAFLRDVSIDPGTLYRSWLEQIKKQTLSPYSLPVNELIAFSRKQLETLGFSEIECALITTFNLFAQWQQALVNVGSVPGTRVESQNYFTYLETRPFIREEYKNHIKVSNWFLLCKEIILALSKKYITIQTDLSNLNDGVLLNPQRMAFSKTTVDWVKGRVGPYFHFNTVPFPGSNLIALKRQLFNRFLKHLSDWYVVISSNTNPNTVFNDSFVVTSTNTPENTDLTKIRYPFTINKKTFTIPNRQPEEQREITLGDFGHYKKNNTILARSDKDFPLSILNTIPHIWDQNVSTMSSTFQFVPSYITGVIFIEFVLKNKTWLRTRFIPFQIKSTDFN